MPDQRAPLSAAIAAEREAALALQTELARGEAIHIKVAIAECTAARAATDEAVKAVEADAARWRFLRDHWPNVLLTWIDTETGDFGGEHGDVPLSVRTPTVSDDATDEYWQGDTPDEAADKAIAAFAQRPVEEHEEVRRAIYVDGERFICECGASVFHPTFFGTWECNECEREYTERTTGGASDE